MLWFATSQGPVWLDPQRIPRNVLPPPVSIVSLVAGGRNYDSSTPLELPPRTANVQISYTALSLSIPERVRFRYKLDGLDKDWQEVGTGRVAVYNKLGPGFHRFHVLACNNDGVWNQIGATLDFRIVPAYYQTVWFRVLCAVCGIWLLWLLYLFRLKRATVQIQQRLGAQMEERERIARELHDTLLQGLQGLMLRFQAVMEEIPNNEPARGTMEKVLERADEVMLEGRERVFKLRAEAKHGEDLPQAITACGEDLTQNQTAQFTMDIVGTPQPLDPVVLDEAYRIGREALVNAFEHSNASRIEGEITYESARVRLSIRDNGDGINPGILKSGRTGHWGLSGMRERAQNIGGQLNLWSNPGAGTEVELIIPSEVAYQLGARQQSWKWIKRLVSGGR
jgi:signal transduction histidine kinase